MTKALKARMTIAWLLAAVACAAVAGCTQGSAPPAALAGPAALTVDEKVLRFLDCYDPQYKVDADGHVVNLGFTWQHLPTPVMTEIGNLTELRGLGLGWTTVNDDGLAQLKDLQKLRTLYLRGTHVTDKGLIHIEKLQSLQYVWLPKETVTLEAKKRLKDARPDMTIYLQ